MSEKFQVDELQIVSIITSAGEANASLQLAFQEAINENEEKVNEYLKQADEALYRAHRTQTELIQKESTGLSAEITLLVVHAQDHLMNVILSKQLINNMIEMQKQINSLKERLK